LASPTSSVNIRDGDSVFSTFLSTEAKEREFIFAEPLFGAEAKP